MDMTLRWYGEGNDSVTLDQIRQIPGVTGVITALHEKKAGSRSKRFEVSWCGKYQRTRGY